MTSYKLFFYTSLKIFFSDLVNSFYKYWKKLKIETIFY